MEQQHISPEVIQAQITRLENLVKPFGWALIATDTRGDDLTVTLSKLKREITNPAASRS